MTKNRHEISSAALSVIEEEGRAILNLRKIADGPLTAVIEKLSQCRGRIVVSGVGKSGIIASKIVATMNSTGTSALFLHCADAVHGDLGMVQKDDMVILISKSGNTQEVKRLVPFIRNAGNYLVGMVSNMDSYLAHHSDDVIYVPVEKEACQNNLAPTVSTTAQLVVGDAIAVTLSGMKGFGKEDFARYHPGGSLGKRLYMKVEDVFDGTNKPSVSPGESIQNTIINISAHRLGATVVLEDDEILGIITDGDVRRMVERGGDLGGLTARDIMSVHPKQIDVGALAVDALEIMEKNEITSVLVLKGGHYAGLVHIHDIMKEGIG